MKVEHGQLGGAARHGAPGASHPALDALHATLPPPPLVGAGLRGAIAIAALQLLGLDGVRAWPSLALAVRGLVALFLGLAVADVGGLRWATQGGRVKGQERGRSLGSALSTGWRVAAGLFRAVAPGKCKRNLEMI